MPESEVEQDVRIKPISEMTPAEQHEAKLDAQIAKTQAQVAIVRAQREGSAGSADMRQETPRRTHGLFPREPRRRTGLWEVFPIKQK